MLDPVLITKADGSLAPFDAEKLTLSLERSGADRNTAAQVVRTLIPRIVPGLSTQKIHQMAFQLLRKQSRGSAARYRLKQAILDLGPSGYPFERFVGRILAHDGYAVQVGVTVEGRCVRHEVDVVAEKGAQHFLVECKYHNTPGRVCDVKIPLYIKARFDDVSEHWRDLPGNGDRFTQGWLVTNTRLTADAMRYGQCAGLRMLGWDQPAQGSLKQRIDRRGLYPLTCLSSLTKAEKERLLASGLVLVRDVMEQPEALKQAMVRAPRVSAVLRDAEILCTAQQ